MNGGRPRMGNFLSGSKSLQLQGLRKKLEIVSLSATSTAKILIGAENMCSRPSLSSSGKPLKKTSIKTPPGPRSFVPSSKIRNRSTLPPYVHLSKPFQNESCRWTQARRWNFWHKYGRNGISIQSNRIRSYWSFHIGCQWIHQLQGPGLPAEGYRFTWYFCQKPQIPVCKKYYPDSRNEITLSQVTRTLESCWK